MPTDNTITTEYATGLNLYAFLISDADERWNNSLSAWEPYDVSHWAAYALAMTETGTSGHYSVTVPVAITAMHLTIAIAQRLTGMPLVTDVADGWLASDEGDWTGAAWSTIGVGWYYANEQAVEDLIGTANLDIISQLDPDSTARDTARIQRGGEWADSYIDGKLGAFGWTVPLPKSPDAGAMNNSTVKLLEDVNARLVTWWSSNNRPTTAESDDEQRKAVLALYKNHKKMADDILDQIIGGLILIVPGTTVTDWRGPAGGGTSTPITPALNNNDVNRMDRLNRLGLNGACAPILP